MLKPLEAVDWSGLTHAQGEADDIPDLIGQLRDEDWDEAADELYVALMHGHQAHPATLAAVPYLVQVALDPSAHGQLAALQLLDVFAGFAAGCGPQAVLAQHELAQALTPLAADPDPEVRRAIYRSALSWPASAGMLRERLAVEENGRALKALVGTLARLGALTAEDLSGFGDEVVFNAAWVGVASGHEVPGALDHLARLWVSQSAVYSGSGSGYPLSALVEQAGGRVVGLLTRLMAEPGIAAGELIWAWHDAARHSRSAAEPALGALLELAGQEELSEEDAEDVLGALLQLLAAGLGGSADVVANLRLSGAPEGQATLAVALFALGDPRWATPALAATAAAEVPWVTLGSSSLEFGAALAAVRHPVLGVWAESGLTAVSRAAIVAWPQTVGTWVDLLAQLPPSPEVVEALLHSSGKSAMRLLARTALRRPGAFDMATYQAVHAIAVPGGDAGAWLLVAQALLDSGDPVAFARAWRVSESGEGEDELLRVWATHPSPELERVCLELATKTSWGVHRNRAVQVAALEILLRTFEAEDEELWPALLDLLEVPSALGDAVALGNRVVADRPGRGPQWLARLAILAEDGQVVAVEAVQAGGGTTPEKALEQAVAGLRAAAGTRRAPAVVPVAGRVIRNALAARPDLRASAERQVGALITGDERVLAPGDVPTDTGLVRVLHEALTA